MEAVWNRRLWQQGLMLSACLLQLFFSQTVYADFLNGNFEATYTPDSTTFSPITNWTQTGYTFGGATVVPPTSLNDITLTPNVTPGAITNMMIGPTQTLYDYFLFRSSSPFATLLLPIAGSQSAMINVRSQNTPYAKSGTNNVPSTPSTWAAYASHATSISQQIIVQASDVDATDGKVHIRFIAAPIMENAPHSANQQPFFAFQLNNITTGQIGANPVFFQWNYGGQPGVPWQTITGTNTGSDLYYYTNSQAYDIAPGNAFIHVGDTIELVALASGCSPGGHDGHIYLDQVGTAIPSGLLWVSATGPGSSTPGNNITYTYTYTNTEATAVNNVQVVANLPVPTTASSPASTSFVSVTTPTTGTSPACSGTGPVTCTIGTLQPGQTGTFQLTVNIPSAWTTSVGPVNNGNYPISGTGVNPLLGPLVQTALVAPSGLSNLVANVSGLPTTGTIGTPYSGSFTCSNPPVASASGDAPNASCDVVNLPAGLSVTGCTISPANATWTEPATIPTNQTVTCSVSGTPTTTGSVVATVTTNAANNSNSTQNQASETITISNALVNIPATLNGSSILSPAVVCCGRPVLLGPLPIPGNGPTTYFVSAHTGDAICFIGQSGSQTYLKMNATNGSCTIVGTKNGVFSAPFTIVAP